VVHTQSLETFRAVARCGSITGAAQELRLTQSAVSRQVAALETEVGARLLDRLPRGVALTEEGRCLLGHAEAILDRLASVHRDIAVLRGVGAGRVRIGAFPTAVAALVPRAIASFRRDHPNVAVSLVEGHTPILLERLLDEEADVAVVSAPPDSPLDGARFRLYHLLDERMYVAVARTHRLARRRVVRLKELAEEPMVVGSATAEEALLRASMAPGFSPRIDLVAAEWTGKLGCVAAGLGFALLPALAARAAPSDIALLRVHRDDASVRRIFAATVARRTPSPAAGRLIAHLRSVAKELAVPAP